MVDRTVPMMYRVLYKNKNQWRMVDLPEFSFLHWFHHHPDTITHIQVRELPDGLYVTLLSEQEKEAA